MAVDLSIFVDAQRSAFDQARLELAAGEKKSHWMWFIFPKLTALGQSHTARRFGIASLDDAGTYINDAVLGPRLLEVTREVLSLPVKSVESIFGFPDNLKFRSSMTLFAVAPPEHPEFRAAIDRFFGSPDPRTLELLNATWPPR